MVKPKLNYKEFLLATRPKMRPVSKTRVSQFMYALYSEYKETQDLNLFWMSIKISNPITNLILDIMYIVFLLIF